MNDLVAPGTPPGSPDTTELKRHRTRHVVARVVLAERPTSAKPGDTAIVLPDGTIDGFVGGTCAESTVRAQALALLDSGESILLRISPTPEVAQAGKVCVHNPCLSGGTLEIFLEPVLPAPLLVVHGDAPIARALRVVGAAVGWDVVDADSSLPLPVDAAAVVIASHGRNEEDVLRVALATDVRYIGLVASRKRGEAVVGSLGMCSSHTSRVHTPAGLDLGARTPQEIALTIIAEIISTRPSPSARPIANADSHEVSTTAIDPVCSMTVAMVESSLHLDHEGTRVWFCGSGCLRAFASSPTSYAH
jgi:xanthine dehydrogenase accessory factor